MQYLESDYNESQNIPANITTFAYCMLTNTHLHTFFRDRQDVSSWDTIRQQNFPDWPLPRVSGSGSGWGWWPGSGTVFGDAKRRVSPLIPGSPSSSAPTPPAEPCPPALSAHGGSQSPAPEIVGREREFGKKSGEEYGKGLGGYYLHKTSLRLKKLNKTSVVSLPMCNTLSAPCDYSSFLSLLKNLSRPLAE